MFTREIPIRTGAAQAVVDLTDAAGDFLGEARAGEGLFHAFVPHATAGLAVLETGAGSDEDLLAALEQLLPRGFQWSHRHGSSGHGRDHVLPALVAPFCVLPVLNGRLALGTWQSLCLVDTNVDNPERRVRFSWIAG